MSNPFFFQSAHGIHADLKVADGSQQNREQQLGSGIIPPDLREEWKLVDESSPLGTDFQRYMTDLTKGLLRDAGKIEEADTLNIRFFLTGEEQPNAGIVTCSEPKIMMVSKGLWRIAQTRDHIEAVVGHELGHGHIYDRIGGHQNSKSEESSVDFYGTYLLSDAGRNTEALKEVLLLLDGDRENLPPSWSSYVDPHPSTNLRIRLLENIYENIREARGGYSTASVPLGLETKNRFSEFSYTTPFQEILEQVGYAAMPIEEKVAWLGEAAPYVKEWRAQGYNTRASELCELVTSTAIDLHEFQYRAFSQSISLETWPDIRSAVEKHESLKKPLMYAALATSDGWTYGKSSFWLKEADPLQPLGGYVESFMKAQTFEAAQSAATQILSVTSLIDLQSPSLLQAIKDKRMLPAYTMPTENEIRDAEITIAQEFFEKMPTALDPILLFEELTEKHGVKLPWHKEVGFYLESGSPEILETLRLLGVKDPRFPALPEDPNVPEPSTVIERGSRWTTKEEEAYPTISSPPDTPDTRYFSFARHSSSGLLIGTTHETHAGEELFSNDRFEDGKGFVQDYDYTALYAHENLRLVQSEHQQKIALERADFSELDQDFWGFVAKHQEVLTPDQGIQDESAPFQAEFLQHLEHLIVQSPERYIPLAYEFFAGRDYSSGSPIFFDDAQGRTTLPILLDNKACNNYQLYNPKRKSYADLPFGIGVEHPFISFIIRDSHGIFKNLEEREPILDYVRWQVTPNMPTDGKPEDLIDPRILGLFTIDPSREQVMRLITEDQNRIVADTQAIHRAERFPSPQESLFSRNKLDGYSSPLYLDEALKNATIYSFLKENKVPLDYEDTKNIFIHSDIAVRRMPSIQAALSSVFEAQFLRNIPLDLSPQTPPLELLQKYDVYAATGMFQNKPELRREYQKNIIARVNNLENPQILGDVTEKLLSKHTNTPPFFKQWLIQTWSKSQASLLSQNGTTDPWEIAWRVSQNTPIQTAYPMLASLAEEARYGKNDAYHAERRLEDKGMKDMAEQAIKSVFGEVLIDYVGKSPTLRQQLIDYLSAVETEESTSATLDVIEREVKDAFRSFRRQNPNPSVDLPKEVKIDLVRLMHENYSSWPLEWQGLFLEKVIFPVNDNLDRHGGQKITIEDEAKIILDRAFSAQKQSSTLAKDYMECHLAELSPAGQRIYLAILMAATKEKEVDIGEPVSEMREMGRTIGRILSKMHPLGAKFAQEIESYAGTDSELRQGLRDIDVKAGVDLGTRWGLWHQLEKMAKEDPESFPAFRYGVFVDRVLGGGSVQLNVALKKRSRGGEAKMSALALLRENVHERAERQHRVFGNALRGFTKKHPQFSELIAILNSSYQNLKIEADYSLAPQQAGNMQKIYQGAHIVADGIKVEFSAVPFEEHGKKFKSYGMAEGTHFNDLPVSTPQDIKIKRAAAKAIMTRELVALLRGEAVDSDRHGKQQKIMVFSDAPGDVQLQVRNFDDGAMALTRPTSEEKKALGDVLGKTLNLILNQNMSAPDALMQITQAYQESPHSHYIETSKRVLRTVLGDYINAEFQNKQGETERLISPKDMQDVFVGVLQDGRGDPQIFFAAAQQVQCERSTKNDSQGVGRKIIPHMALALAAVFDFVRPSGLHSKPAVVVQDSKQHRQRLRKERRKGLGIKPQFQLGAQEFAARVMMRAAARKLQRTPIHSLQAKVAF